MRSKCKEDDVKMKIAFFKEKLAEQLGSIYTEELIIAAKPIFIVKETIVNILSSLTTLWLCTPCTVSPFACSGWMRQRRLAKTLVKARWADWPDVTPMCPQVKKLKVSLPDLKCSNGPNGF